LFIDHQRICSSPIIHRALIASLVLMVFFVLSGCARKITEQGADSSSAQQLYERGLQAGKDDGAGKPVDPVLAVSLLEQAAQKDYLPALHALAWLYYEGRGVDKDLVQAKDYLYKAATAGYADSQYLLGIFYGQGWAVEKNFVTSLQWIKRAADQGHVKAKKALETLFKKPASATHESK
jgi:uncharacterized protein